MKSQKYIRKGQTSTEYLVITAVVIIIALIVVTTLGGIPGIGGGTSDAANNAKLHSLSVGIHSYVQDAHSTRFTVVNNNPNTIQVTGATVNGRKCTLYPQPTLAIGQSQQVTCYGVINRNHNQRYQAPITIEYRDTTTQAIYIQDEDAKLIGVVPFASRLHTGQQGCYEGSFGMTGPVTCISAHAGQDGNADGTAKSFTNMGGNVIRDDHTGLYWTTNETADITRADALIYCDSLTQGGSSSWRLPNIVELTTVMNSGVVSNPSPNGEWANGVYWASTSQSDPYYWYYLSSEDGFFYGTRTPVVPLGNVRAVCVRGSTTGITLSDGEKSFVDVGDGTVVDTDTGIIWSKAAYYDGTNYWNNSIEYCDNLGTGGYSDWRVPTVSEGATLIDYSCESAGGDCFARYMNGVFTHGYSEDPSDWQNLIYWTGTTPPSVAGYAYFVYMDHGHVYWGVKDTGSAVRCVRDRG